LSGAQRELHPVRNGQKLKHADVTTKPDFGLHLIKLRASNTR
jgi:hypothetical protein